MDIQQRVFPVALLLAGRPCLVLGGGKVATRKVSLLLEADAAVTVISPALGNELRQLADQSAIRWIPRPFEPADLDGMFLVYAATDSRIANRAALNLCRQRGILCCPVDDAWADGDFLTPATIRDGDLTIAINTAGHACRRSRLIKQSVSRHIGLVNQAELLVIGTSHEQLDIASRERLQRLGSHLESCGDLIFRVWGIHEFLLLSTCNRLELHAVGVPDKTSLALLLRILEFDRLEPGQYYVHTGMDAFEHSCAVAAGLLSQMPGEYHIVAQIKDALQAATVRQHAGGMMQEWVDDVLHISAELRSRSGPSTASAEIEDMALAFLQDTGNAAAGGRVLLLGTGRLGMAVLQRAAERLAFRSLDWFWHRTAPCVPVALQERVTPRPLDQLHRCLPEADVIISALDSDQYILSAPDLQARTGDPARPLTILDLGVPRNVDPAISTLSGTVSLTDLDGLKRWNHRTTTDTATLRERCHELVIEHKAYHDKLIASFQGRDPRQ
jgi:glutamyl-tRNA reductase